MSGSRPSARGIFAVAISALVLLGLACSAPRDRGEKPLATEDVSPTLDLSIEDDVQEKRRAPALSGVLPGDFPSELPLHLPASLINFGNDGKRSVTLLSSDPPGVVRASLEAKLDAAGWSRGPASAGGIRLSRGGIEARLVLEDAKPGTRYLYYY